MIDMKIQAGLSTTRPWGIIVPGPTGIFYSHQTEGVCCRHPVVEGSFLPIPYPVEFGKDYRTRTDLNREVGNKNYLRRGGPMGPDSPLWKRIKKALNFDFELVDPPPGQPENQEGLWWIKITEFGTFNEYTSEWQVGWNIKELIGVTVCLIYQNSD